MHAWCGCSLAVLPHFDLVLACSSSASAPTLCQCSNTFHQHSPTNPQREVVCSFGQRVHGRRASKAYRAKACVGETVVNYIAWLDGSVDGYSEAVALREGVGGSIGWTIHRPGYRLLELRFAKSRLAHVVLKIDLRASKHKFLDFGEILSRPLECVSNLDACMLALYACVLTLPAWVPALYACVLTLHACVLTLHACVPTLLACVSDLHAYVPTLHTWVRISSRSRVIEVLLFAGSHHAHAVDGYWVAWLPMGASTLGTPQRPPRTCTQWRH
jgi:hypothetical protein